MDTALQEDLISRGYKKHVSEIHKTFKMTDTLFQKRISDDKGKKYFIDIWYYVGSPSHNFPESIQAEVQFHDGDGITEESMNVQLFIRDITKIEEVFENMWGKLGLNYYELWDEP